MTSVFSRVYQTNAWNGRESLSGPGSGYAATAHVGPAIVALVAELGVASVLDAACGDGLWMPELPGYVGIDVAPEAIHRARRNHPGRCYLVGDARALTMPPATLLPVDLVILRDAIQHLSFADGIATLNAIRSSGARWLLASTYVGGENVDIVTGEHYSPDLNAAPFSMGEPLRLIPDGYSYHDPALIRDRRKMLGLWALA